ncbi:hypothetical protein ACFYS8_31860 [Kitasatospora sp. NPDC004615]|uniref:hypothetical protein n=1 Tax=Kitasatospora sp. NPDC004615 TaxID=3364017 RepID=UPI0036CF74BD
MHPYRHQTEAAVRQLLAEGVELGPRTPDPTPAASTRSCSTAPPAAGARPHPDPPERKDTPLTIHPANLLPDGRWDDRLFELDYEGRQGRYRVVRGLGEQIGTVEKHGGVWMPKNTAGAWIGAAAGRSGYLTRQVAAVGLSITVPLPPPEGLEQYRVTPSPTPSS